MPWFCTVLAREPKAERMWALRTWELEGESQAFPHTSWWQFRDKHLTGLYLWCYLSTNKADSARLVGVEQTNVRAQLSLLPRKDHSRVHSQTDSEETAMMHLQCGMRGETPLKKLRRREVRSASGAALL